LLNDVKETPINVSLTLLHALHTRWYAMLKTVDAVTLQQRLVIHPAQGKEMTLWFLLGMYAWHGRHHVAHITSLRDKMNW